MKTIMCTQSGDYNYTQASGTRHWRRVYENMPLAYCALDSHGKIQSANTYAIQLLGRSEKELVGKSIFELSEDDSDKDATHETISWKAFESCERAEQVIKIHPQNRQMVWLKLIFQPIYNASQRIQGFQLYCIDITSIKNHELELQALIDQIAEKTRSLMDINEDMKQRNDRYLRFSHDIAHEIRNPLTVIGLRLYLLERTFPYGIDNHLDILRKQVVHVTNLVDSISSFAAANENKSRRDHTVVNLTHVIDNVIASHRPQAEGKAIQLWSETPQELALVHGNATQLTQVFSNLLTNALNYTFSGHVSIAIAIDTRTRQINARVQDTGIGIPTEDLPHVFDRFYRGQNVLKANIPGTGIGLDIVQQIIQSHNGYIEVCSTEGEGTTFMVTLPWLDVADEL